MQRSQGTLSGGRRSLVVDDQDELVVEGGLDERDAVELIGGSVGSIEHVDVEAAELCEIDLAEVAFDEGDVGAGRLEAGEEPEKLRLGAAEV